MDLETYYRINTTLKRSDLHFNIQEIEQLYPYEREFYMLVAKDLQDEETKENWHSITSTSFVHSDAS